MILYADTSALAKLLVQEDGTERARAAVASAEVLACAAIGYVELRAAVAAAIRDGRIAAALRESTVLNLERIWQGVSEVRVDSALLRVAGTLAEERRLRAYDAVHLAALCAVRQGLATSASTAHLTFACWDSDLRRAAGELGFRLLPNESFL
jgi:hypothetical protein